MHSTPESGQSAPLQQCKCCNASVNPDHFFCPVCKFPLKGTEKEQDAFIYRLGYKQEELKTLKTKTENAAITFYLIAGLTLLSGLVLFFINVKEDASIYVLAVLGGLGVIFILLGSWSNKQPVSAIICGLVLYLLLFITDFLSVSVTLPGGLITKVIVIAVLVRALINALKAREIKKEYKI